MPEIGDTISPRKLGRKTTNTLIWASCIDCGKERWVATYAGKPESRRCRTCNGKTDRKRLSGINHPMWRGGRFINRYGYVWVMLLGNDLIKYYSMGDAKHYVAEHRLIMARHLGRCLNRGEVVHHVNGVKTDNRLENLELVTRTYHNGMGYKMGYERGYADGYARVLSEARNM